MNCFKIFRILKSLVFEIITFHIFNLWIANNNEFIIQPAMLATTFPVLRSTMAMVLSEHEVAMKREVKSITAETKFPSSSSVPK